MYIHTPSFTCNTLRWTSHPLTSDLIPGPLHAAARGARVRGEHGRQQAAGGAVLREPVLVSRVQEAPAHRPHLHLRAGAAHQPAAGPLDATRHRAAL